MVDAAAARSNGELLRTIELYAFCVFSFTAKSVLLIGLPYREWPVNTVYTCTLLLVFYLYFRFRQKMIAPPFVLFCMAAAVAVDVLGNKFGLYGHPFGPLRDYDEFAHFAGSGFSAVGAFWLMRAGMRRLGFKLSSGLLVFLSTSVAFTYCGWYEILEHWDELFWSHFERIHWWYDTANDLFYDFIGVIAFVTSAALLLKLRGQRQEGDDFIPLRLKDLFSNLPKDFLAFLVTTVSFGLCAWFEIFRMFDQRWFGRIHLIEKRDTVINLEYELVASVVLAIAAVGMSKLAERRKASVA